ncbi:MAG TPA: ATP-binding protein [Treponemataceae bacterium]|nr:ATP-binding protein [Treponemataceae bacterium]
MIERESYMQKIRPFMNTPLIKVITGIRRCGKSVMMELIQKELLTRGIFREQVLSLNFESKTDTRVKSIQTVLDSITKLVSSSGGKRIYLFLDEIQELNGWEKLVNSFLADTDIDIYITGSNAKLLSGELATFIAGRYVEIKMYPLSFKEVIQLLNENQTDISINEAFLMYINRGGFPFLYNYPFSDQDAYQYISDIFDSIVLKDISQRNNIRDISQLRNLILYFAANIGNTFSAASLVKYLKNQQRSVSTETIYNYIEYCRSACLLHLVQRQDIGGKALLSTQEKIYFSDHGIREALYGSNQRDINQVLENIVYMELLRRGFGVTVGKIKNAEVDFCAEKNGEKLYIQVTYLLASKETIEREFGAFAGIQDNYPKYVLSLDDIDLSREGIIHKNIRTFLLE